MKIEKDRVVSFHYTVSEQGQEPLESSEGRDPLVILVGHGNIIPGLETAMEGHEAGDKFEVDVAAADAYGEKREGLSQRVPLPAPVSSFSTLNAAPRQATRVSRVQVRMVRRSSRTLPVSGAVGGSGRTCLSASVISSSLDRLRR